MYAIYKDDVLVDSLIDNTYGTYHNLSALTYTKAFTIEWYKVLALLGEGCYKVNLLVTDPIGGNVNIFSNEYHLQEYQPLRADKTIRFEWFQNGTIGDF